MIAGAILHDTVEDTDTSLDEIEAVFGKPVRDIVAEVTDNKDLAKEERKRLQIVHAPHKSAKVRFNTNKSKPINMMHCHDIFLFIIEVSISIIQYYFHLN